MMSKDRSLKSQKSKHGFYEEFSVVPTDAKYSHGNLLSRRGSKSYYKRIINTS